MSTPLHIVSLGCARNDVDSEELAGRFAAAGFELVDQAERAEVVVVNTCGFIESAKAESIDEILGAAELKKDGRVRTVVATGCLAERYGADLASSLPEADAVIGFDGYDRIAESVRQVMAGGRVKPHRSADRRQLLPVAPAERVSSFPVWLPRNRVRLDDSPTAPLKIAAGCDRRCAFCAIPSFRGAFQSRHPDDILGEAAWLAQHGVKELFLVSENTTSYGKDLGLGLEALLADLAQVEGVGRVRLSYLQPAQVRPSLIEAVARTPKVAAYFDLPFQHASAEVLRRMRRFGDAESFLGLLGQIRAVLPEAGVRSNFIVGFPGETEADVAALVDFLGEAGLDAVGVFGYSDEEGTEAAGLDGHLDDDEITARTREVSIVADTVTGLRAQDRIGERVQVLVESRDGRTGRADQQGPEDGGCALTGDRAGLKVGDLVSGRIVGSDGVDWVVAL